MNDPLAFRGTYADWKLIKTRGVVQVVMEVPLADADAAYKVLGGMPDASREHWFAIAPLKLPQAEKEITTPSPKSSPQPTHPPAAAKRMDWRELQPAAQAALRCNDATFRAFLMEEHSFRPRGGEFHEDQAAEFLRNFFGVKSRSELGSDHRKRVLWKQMDDSFSAWKALERT